MRLRSLLFVGLVLMVLPRGLYSQPTRRPDISLTADRIFAFRSEIDLSNGLGATIELHQYLGRSPVTLLAGLTYGFLPLEPLTSVHLLSPVIGAGIRQPIIQDERFLIMASGGLTGGPYVATLGNRLLQPNGAPYENQTGLGGVLRAVAQIAIHLGPRFSLEIGGDYGWYAGLSHSARLRVGASLATEELGFPVDLIKAETSELYPSLANRYSRETPIAIEVFNRSRFPVDDVWIGATSGALIQGTATAAEIDRIAPEQSARAVIRFPFSRAAATNEDEQQVQIDLQVGGRVANRATDPSQIGSLETTLLGRNSLTWTDDRKAASFVTPTSEGSILLSREISSVARGRQTTVDPMLQFAIATTEAIGVLGIEYSVDPNLPAFVTAQANTLIVDYLQYPEDTLRFASGDCDDMSILFASVLEAAGVRAGFITVPGHLFAAVQLSMTPEQAQQTFLREQDFIVRDGSVWIPVETTVASQGFVSAWKTGARQWNDANANDEAELIPIVEAWEAYPPAISKPAEDTRQLNVDLLAERLEREILRFVQTEFAPAIRRLEDQIEDRGRSVRALANLGVFYARAGAFAKAEEYFHQVLELERHPHALINLGNIRRMEGRFGDALALYQEAEKQLPSSTSLWLSISLTLRELDRNEESERYYQRYAERRPTDAAAYAYVGSPDEEGARASLAGTASTLYFWEAIPEVDE